MKSYEEIIAPKENVELIFMSLDQSKDRALNWAVKEKFPWPLVLADKQKRSGLTKFAAAGIPYYVLIDKEGKIIAKGKHNCFEKIKDL